MQKEKLISLSLALSLVLTSGCAIKSNKKVNNESNITEDVIESVTPTIEVMTTPDIFYQNNDFATVLKDTNLYDEYGNIIEVVEKCQKVLRISSNSNLSFVQTESLQNGYIYNDDLEILPDLFVEVDISDQTVKMYKDNEVILTTLTVTGKTSTPTRVGYFPITYKTYDTYLTGPGYKSHVYYWMPFDGGIGLHDAAWRDSFGGDIYINNGSHGCVNLPHDAAKEIYENVDAGTMVLVHN